MVCIDGWVNLFKSNYNFFDGLKRRAIFWIVAKFADGVSVHLGLFGKPLLGNPSLIEPFPQFRSWFKHDFSLPMIYLYSLYGQNSWLLCKKKMKFCLPH